MDIADELDMQEPDENQLDCDGDFAYQTTKELGEL